MANLVRLTRYSVLKRKKKKIKHRWWFCNFLQRASLFTQQLTSNVFILSTVLKVVLKKKNFFLRIEVQPQTEIPLRAGEFLDCNPRLTKDLPFTLELHCLSKMYDQSSMDMKAAVWEGWASVS